AHWMLRHDGFSYAIQVTTFSGVRLLHGPIALADALQAATTLFGGAAVFIASRWGKPDVRGAMLALSFPLILSVMLDYDLTVCAVAIPFLWQAIRRTGALAWEKTAMVGLFALPVVSFFIRFQLHFPADTLLLVWLMLVLLKRVKAEHEGNVVPVTASLTASPEGIRAPSAS
ncbi:MAG TPA: hypothetical protein VF407_16560, partial [Polyangiaceae bacterium]